ncbi:MAG: hypothetical protein ATN32_02620 [Candidatus Epulonipiscium fishelsonii]|nr:MAG: hypothetical protein ATN32_02620 [Epulopiscium sp. AS2M-Bin002]
MEQDNYLVDEDDTNNSVDMIPFSLNMKDRKQISGWVSFVLGIVGSATWIFPLLALPFTIMGTVFGALGLRNKRGKEIAIAGFVINIVFLVVAIAKGIVDIIFYFKNSNK